MLLPPLPSVSDRKKFSDGFHDLRLCLPKEQWLITHDLPQPLQEKKSNNTLKNAGDNVEGADNQGGEQHYLLVLHHPGENCTVGEDVHEADTENPHPVSTFVGKKFKISGNVSRSWIFSTKNIDMSFHLRGKRGRNRSPRERSRHCWRREPLSWPPCRSRTSPFEAPGVILLLILAEHIVCVFFYILFTLFNGLVIKPLACCQGHPFVLSLLSKDNLSINWNWE